MILSIMAELSEIIEKVVEVLQKSTTRRLLFITGAGASAESGLPTYRGVGGLYNEADTEEGLPIETILSKEMMLSRPELTWKYLHEMEAFSRGKKLNPVHENLARFDNHFETVILTQNIDGFHKQAGSKHVIEIHGNIHNLRCTHSHCDWRTSVKDFSHLEKLPKCENCGTLIRPEVVLFGEALPVAEQVAWQNYNRFPFDIVFSIGTTSVFPYIQAPVLQAHQNKKLTLEVNPTPTILSEIVDYKVTSSAGIFLTQLWKKFAESLQ